MVGCKRQQSSFFNEKKIKNEKQLQYVPTSERNTRYTTSSVNIIL